MQRLPIELNLNGVYFPPWLLSVLAGFLLALVLTAIANRLRLSRFVWHPPLFFVALTVACSVAVGATVVPSFFG